MKVRDIIKQLESEGWHYVGTKGSHRHYKHPVKPRKVTVVGHPSQELDINAYIQAQREEAEKARLQAQG